MSRVLRVVKCMMITDEEASRQQWHADIITDLQNGNTFYSGWKLARASRAIPSSKLVIPTVKSPLMVTIMNRQRSMKIPTHILKMICSLR